MTCQTEECFMWQNSRLNDVVNVVVAVSVPTSFIAFSVLSFVVCLFLASFFICMSHFYHALPATFYAANTSGGPTWLTRGLIKANKMSLCHDLNGLHVNLCAWDFPN